MNAAKQYKKVQKRAHELYEKRGRVSGHELDDWLTAERQVMDVKQTINPWIQVLIVPVFIALVGGFVTFLYNKKQEEISRVQTLEKFIEYFSPGHPPEQQVAALVTMMKLGYTDQATDLLLFVFTGQVLGSHPAVVNFVQTYGEVLLPRLCTLVETSPSAEGVFGPASGIRYTVVLYIRQILQTDSGKTKFITLITDNDVDEDIRSGALYALNDVQANSSFDTVFNVPTGAFQDGLKKIVFSGGHS